MSDRVRPRNATGRIAYTITTPRMVRPTTAAKTSLCPQIPNRSSRHNALCVPGGRFCHPPHRTYPGISAIGGAQNSALGEGRASRDIRKDIGILLIRRYPTAGKSGCASPLVRCALAGWVHSGRFKASSGRVGGSVVICQSHAVEVLLVGWLIDGGCERWKSKWKGKEG
jgi:hypothetical protein